MIFQPNKNFLILKIKKKKPWFFTPSFLSKKKLLSFSSIQKSRFLDFLAREKVFIVTKKIKNTIFHPMKKFLILTQKKVISDLGQPIK